MRRLIASIAALSLGGPALAQDMPPVPRALVDTSALVCVKIDRDGHTDAFILDSKGDAAHDKAVLAWVRQLKWPAAEAGDGSRNVWFPMPVAFGNAPSPALPKGCAPGADQA